MEKKYYYEIEYASGILRDNCRQNQVISSDERLQIDNFVIVEHMDCGVFIAKITKDVSDGDNYFKNTEYKYLKDIDLSDWVEKNRKKERMEQLKEEMERKFQEIDKKKKFKYYAQIDDDFRELYLEYESLKEDKK